MCDDRATEHLDGLRGLNRRASSSVVPVALGRDGEVERLTVEVVRLRHLVKAAYLEGRRALWDPDYEARSWQASESRAALGES